VIACVVGQWDIIKGAAAAVMGPPVIIGAMIWDVTMAAPAGATDPGAGIMAVPAGAKTLRDVITKTPAGAMNPSIHGQGAS